MVLYGRAPAPTQNGRWLALFRSGAEGFCHADCLIVDALWPHLKRAIEMNLHRTLDHREGKSQTCAAFLNFRGFLEVAEPGFMQLLQLEWPGHSKIRLPVSAIAAMMEKQSYQGKHISLIARRYTDYIICTAQCLDHVPALGPSERQVARYFASGMTNKEIASKVGTSPHTVRMQLKNVYRKLGVHSKIELARTIR
jgi:DNA-binding CsgD family transcriptional regulator